MAAKDLSASGVLFTDRRNFYIDPQVVKELWTDVTPFTTVIANKETRSVPDPIFKMFEHKQPWVKQSFVCNENTANATANNESADMDIDGIVGLPTPDASWLGLEVECWDSTETTKKGVAIVTTVVSGSGTTGNIQFTPLNNDLDVAVDDVFYVIGNAHGEGGYAPEAWADELKVVYNSCQIFKNHLEITGTLLQASLRGESSELARLRMQKSQEHKIQKERAFLFGKRVGGTGLQESAYADGFNDTNADETFTDGGIDGPAVGTIATPAGSGAGKIRTTYGIVSAIENYGESTSTHDNQNIFTASEASYSYGAFVDDMEKVFQYVPTSGVKKAFVGAGALGYWSKMAGNSGFAGNNGWSVNLGDMKRDALGFNYRTLETPHGMLQMIPTPALRGPYNKYMVVVDEDNLFHSQYRSPMYQTNIKTDNAYDGVKDQYMSDEGIGITNINSHSLIKITA